MVKLERQLMGDPESLATSSMTHPKGGLEAEFWTYTPHPLQTAVAPSQTLIIKHLTRRLTRCQPLLRAVATRKSLRIEGDRSSVTGAVEDQPAGGRIKTATLRCAAKRLVNCLRLPKAGRRDGVIGDDATHDFCFRLLLGCATPSRPRAGWPVRTGG